MTPEPVANADCGSKDAPRPEAPAHARNAVSGAQLINRVQKTEQF